MKTLRSVIFSALSMMMLCPVLSSCSDSDSEDNGGDIIGTWYHVKNVFIEEGRNPTINECSEEDGDCYLTITKTQIKITCRNNDASGTAIDYERKGNIIRAFGADWFEIKSVSSSSLALKDFTHTFYDEKILYYKK